MKDQLSNQSQADSIRLQAFLESATAHEVAQRHIVLLVLYSIIGLVSIVGNGLLLLAIVRIQQMSEKYFLLNLVLTDLLITAVCIPGTCQKFLSNRWLLGDWLCRLVNAAMVSTAAAGIFNHTAMILERSLGVNASRIATNSRDTRATSLKMILAVWFFAVSYGSPVVVLTSASDVSSVFELASLSVTNLPPMCLNSISSPRVSVAYDAVGMLLLYVVPLCVIIAAYVRIIRTVQEVSSQLVRFSNSVTNRSKKIVRLAVTMAVIFAVSWLPLHLSMQVKNLRALIYGESVALYSVDTKFSVLLDIFNCLGLSNCAVNPIYLFLSCHKFRRTLSRTFGRGDPERGVSGGPHSRVSGAARAQSTTHGSGSTNFGSGRRTLVNCDSQL